jgi:hypothetical protein
MIVEWRLNKPPFLFLGIPSPRPSLPPPSPRLRRTRRGAGKDEGRGGACRGVGNRHPYEERAAGVGWRRPCDVVAFCLCGGVTITTGLGEMILLRLGADSDSHFGRSPTRQAESLPPRVWGHFRPVGAGFQPAHAAETAKIRTAGVRNLELVPPSGKE